MILKITSYLGADIDNENEATSIPAIHVCMTTQFSVLLQTLQ